MKKERAALKRDFAKVGVSSPMVGDRCTEWVELEEPKERYVYRLSKIEGSAFGVSMWSLDQSLVPQVNEGTPTALALNAYAKYIRVDTTDKVDGEARKLLIGARLWDHQRLFLGSRIIEDGRLIREPIPKNGCLVLRLNDGRQIEIVDDRG